MDSIKLEKTETEEPVGLEKLLMPEDNLSLTPKRRYDSTTSMDTSYSGGAGVEIEVSTAEKSTNYNIYKTSQSTQTSPTFEYPSLYGATSQLESEELVTENNIQKQQYFINLIRENPIQYLGIPKQFHWVFQHVCKQNRNRVSELTLIITLFKIKENKSLMHISKKFQIESSQITNIFVKGIECLASFFQNIIFLPLPDQIKAQLPHEFKVRYPDVQCILHCLEIEIETPSDPLLQAQTWSKDKYGNTLKYLIGCTPNGFVTFVSKGYGGRISDKEIFERSKIIDILPLNSVIMTEGGFKGVESNLMAKGINLLHAENPGINSSAEQTKEQVLQAKAIKFLEVQIDRMMKRFKQFETMYPLSEVKHKHIGYMDQILIIASGLVNLQGTPVNNN